MLPSQRPMIQGSEVEMQDRVITLETAVDDAVDHGLTPECAQMLRDIGFCTHFDLFRRAVSGDPPARVEPITVRLQPGARAMRAKPRAYLIVHNPGLMRTAGETCYRVG